MEKDKTRRENRNYFFTLLLVRFLLYKYVCVCARVVSLSLSLSLSELFSRFDFFSLFACSLARSFFYARFFFNSFATRSMNCSVVAPDGPDKSRVPLPSRKSLCMMFRMLVVKSTIFLWFSFVSWVKLAWFMAPMRPSTTPSGFKLVSSPRKRASSISVTVP